MSDFHRASPERLGYVHADFQMNRQKMLLKFKQRVALAVEHSIYRKMCIKGSFGHHWKPKFESYFTTFFLDYFIR